MRKKILSSLTLGVTLLMLAACSADDATTVTDNVTQQLAVTFASRSTGDESTGFTTDDKVKVFANLGNSTESTIFTLGNDGKWMADGKNYLAVTLPATLTAVCPATATVATKFTMTGVSSNRIYTIDQSTVEKLKAADYMTSDPLEVTTAPTQAADFNLRHRMCKVTITIAEYGTEFGGTLPTINSETIYSKGYEAIYSNGTWQTQIHHDIDDVAITPLKTSNDTDGKHKYEAIVSLGTYEKNDMLMTLTVNNKTLNVYVDKETNFAMGNHYNYTLKVGKDNILISSATIEEWTNETTQTGNTTNVALPDVNGTDVAGIFVHYADADAANADNLKLSAENSWMIDHTWKSQAATPHIVIYAPYEAGKPYTGTLALANGTAVTDYRYASVNADHTQTVSQLLTNGKLTVTDYKHVMCKLTIAFTDASGKAVTPTAVTLNEVYTAGILTLNTGVIATTGSLSSLSLTAANGKCSDYYIVPQTIGAYSKMLTATIDGKEHNYYLEAAPLVLGAGEHCTLTLSVPAATRALQSTAATERMNASITINNSWK